ncbi:MAG: acylphosphatase [Gemmatimonadota bacterium]
MITVRLLVEGRVQGVGFRWWTRETARNLDLVGHVRNRTDGTVEVLAAGPAAAVADLREALRQGPPAALVERISESEAEPPDTAAFEIRP